MKLPQLLVVLALVVGACRDPEVAPPSTDLVPAEFLATLPRVEVDSVPEITVGLREDQDEHALASVGWALIAADSLIVIGDTRAGRLGVYGFDGEFRRWLGREGEGPGEFKSLRRGGLTADGDVWVFDLSGARLLTYDPNGGALRTVRIPIVSDEGVATVLGVDSEGGIWQQFVDRFWDTEVGNGESATVRSGERHRARVTIRRLLADTSTVVWTGEGDEEVFERIEGGGASSGSNVLAPRLLTALVGDDLVLTRTESSVVDRLDRSGDLRRLLEYPPARVPIGDRYPDLTGAHRYELLPESIVLIPGSDASTWLVLRSPEGNVHPLLHITARGATEVLDPGRAFRNPLFIGESHAVQWNLSEFEAPYVALYRLRRSPP